MNTVIFNKVVNSVYIPALNFGDEKITVNCIFNIRRNYKKLLRRSDLSCLLSAQKYVKLFRDDENLSKI